MIMNLIAFTLAARALEIGRRIFDHCHDYITNLKIKNPGKGFASQTVKELSERR